MTNQSRAIRRVAVAIVAGLGLVSVAAPSFAESPAENPPMMRGYGPGYGMGPGMMSEYGPGYGYGRGYGPGYGMGPGMMRGYGYGPGYGMGPGMMHGYGMGPGMMGDCGGYRHGYNALNLSDAQRDKIRKIRDETARAQWEMMNKMHEAMAQGWEEAQKKIDAVLTKEQREQLHRGWRGR